LSKMVERGRRSKGQGEKAGAGKVLNGAGHIPAEQPSGVRTVLCALCDAAAHTSDEHEAYLVTLEEAQLVAHNAACLELFDAAAVADYELIELEEKDPKSVKSKKDKPDRAEPLDGALIIGVGSLLDNTVDAIELLAEDPNIYQRAGELIRIVRITEAEAEHSKDAKGVKTIESGTPSLKPIPDANLLARMSGIVPCQRYSQKEKEYIPCDAPAKLARSILVYAEYPKVRLIRGVAEAPFLRPDGSVMQTAGYDKQSGYLYAPSARFPKIPDAPSQDAAHAAFLKLHHVYAGLEFVDDAAMACPIAGILTIFAQAAIKGCVPIFMTEANTPGTGKTIVNDTIGIIAAGRPMPRRSFPGPGEELRKVLDAYARDGTRFFCLDNIGQDFGGEALEAAVTTEGHYDLRVLGETRNMRVEWHTIVFGSGNNIGFCRADIIPRTLMSRLETQAEDPRSRDVTTFLIKENLLDYVRRERAELVVAALTMLRAYAHAGKPKQSNKAWGSFEAFNSWIAPAILFAGGPDITTCRLTGDKARSVETDSQHLAMILERLPGLYVRMHTQWMSAGSIIDCLYEIHKDDNTYDALRAAVEGLTSKKRTGEIRPNAGGLGHAFRRCRSQVVGGKRLVEEFDHELGAQLWAVESLN
jgi:hypothetical protein